MTTTATPQPLNELQALRNEHAQLADDYLSAMGALIIIGNWLASGSDDQTAQSMYDMIAKQLDAPSVEVPTELVVVKAGGKSQLEAAKHYATVGEFAINIDVQHFMLDELEMADNWIAWGELSHALSEVDALKREPVKS